MRSVSTPGSGRVALRTTNESSTPPSGHVVSDAVTMSSPLLARASVRRASRPGRSRHDTSMRYVSAVALSPTTTRTTPRRGNVPTSDAWRASSTRSGNAAYLDSDVVFTLGCRFGDRHTGNLEVYTRGRKFIQVDVDPFEIERVIGRAVTDSAFRQALIDDARAACKEYDLTEDELDALEKLDASSLMAFAGTLDQRISKTGGAGFA